MTPSKAPLPFLGTWKLATSESSRPDLPYPTSGLTTFAQEEDGIHYSADSTWSDGRTTNVSALLQLDGTWSPVTGSQLVDSLSFKGLEDGSFEAKGMKGGAHAVTTHATYSADGRTSTAHWELVGPNGATITWETTSERQ
jgi:hypothetical protein